MTNKLLVRAILCIAPAAMLLASPVFAFNHRGMTAGWPNYATGYYAGYYPANYAYQANYAGQPAYYVARPVAGAAYAANVAYAPGAGYAPAAVAYMPVTAAYGNPGY